MTIQLKKTLFCNFGITLARGTKYQAEMLPDGRFKFPYPHDNTVNILVENSAVNVVDEPQKTP